VTATTVERLCIHTPAGAEVDLRIVPDAVAMGREAADVFGDVVKVRADARICFATGNTPKPLYAELLSRQRRGDVDLRSIRAFLLDEYHGLARSDPRSYRAFMRAQLFDAAGVADDRVDSLDGGAEDPEGECARYERAIADAGGWDLVLLGIGRNGHIAFNEPGAGVDARTRLVPLTPATRRANANDFGSPDAVPTHALTVGIGTILDHARRVLLLARGDHKAEALARALVEAEADALPASHLQRFDGPLTVVADAAAAALVPVC